ncbi:MAG: C1 family peptidase [Usitatibacter sp.]
MTQRVYAYRPDLHDIRDHVYSAGATPRPSSVDLRPLCSPVEDQGQLGSCTGNATAGAIELLEVKSGKPLIDISRLWLYYQARVIEGTVRQDAGAMIRDVVKQAAKLGAPDEKLWPYVISKYRTKPTAKAYADAAGRKITEYLRVTSRDGILNCLAEGYPVIVGISVYDSFESDAVAKTGVVPMPKKGESLLGGHAVLIVGYDDATQRYIVRNSWGESWGMHGYFTLPYAYPVSDCWTIRK